MTILTLNTSLVPAVEPDFDLSVDFGQVALPKFVTHLRDSQNPHVFLFVIRVGDCLKLSKNLLELGYLPSRNSKLDAVESDTTEYPGKERRRESTKHW